MYATVFTSVTIHADPVRLVTARDYFNSIQLHERERNTTYYYLHEVEYSEILNIYFIITSSMVASISYWF